MYRSYPQSACIVFLVFAPLFFGCVDENNIDAPVVLRMDAQLPTTDSIADTTSLDVALINDASLSMHDATPTDVAPPNTIGIVLDSGAVFYEQVQITAGRSPLLQVDLPADVTSLTLIAVGEDSVMHTIEHLEGPDGSVLVAEVPIGVEITDLHRRLTPFPGPFLSPNRSASASTGVGTLLAPNNPAVRLLPGPWRFQIGALGSQGRITTDVEITALIKRADRPQVTGRLPVHFFFTGTRGWTAASAPSDPDFQRAVDRMGGFYDAVGIQLVDFTYDDIPMSFRTVDTGPQGPGPHESTLHEMFRLNEYTSGVALFFVDRIGTGQAGGFIAGISGGTPGPAQQPANVRGGIAVATEMSPDPDSIGHVMGHETGHFLGLFHTQEFFGGITDQIPDTPIGQAGGDNLMFPTVTSEPAHLSDGQAWVLHRNILVEPIQEDEP